MPPVHASLNPTNAPELSSLTEVKLLIRDHWEARLPAQIQTPISRAASDGWFQRLGSACAVSQAGYHTGLFFSFDEFYVCKIIKIPSSIFFSFPCLVLLLDKHMLGHGRQLPLRPWDGSPMEYLPSIQKGLDSIPSSTENQALHLNPRLAESACFPVN